jgi:hypothetical protein
MRRLTITVLILACLFSLYSTLNFWTIQAISTPEQLPRMKYDAAAWFAIFFATVIALATVILLGRRHSKK